MKLERGKAGNLQGNTHTLARRIFLTSVANGVAAIVVIIGVALWMADKVNDIARATTKAQVQSALQAELDAVTVSTEDYAYWGLAHSLVTNREDDALYDNFGSGASESSTFDFIYVLDGDGTPLYAYQTGETGSDLSILDHELSALFHAAVIASPVTPYAVKSHFGTDKGQLAVIAASRIRPDELPSEGLTDFPVMIAGNWITDDSLGALKERLLLTDLTLERGTGGDAMTQSILSFTDITGRDFATLTWTADRPGHGLLNAALPVILALSILTLATTLFVGRASARQTHALLEQRQIARTDRLTGLINRAGLDELIASPAYKRAISDGRVAAIYLDLNEFKQLNDTQGHDVGDMALQVFAERVSGTLRAEDAIVRLGGDEFICILVDDNPCQTAETIARRIIKATTPPVHIGDHSHKISPSIGVAIGAPNLSWQDLQKNADRAMYQAKATGKTDPVFFSKGFGNLQAVPRTAAS